MILIFFIALIIISIIIIIYDNNNYINSFKGLWTSSKENCSDMNIDDMWLIIGDIENNYLFSKKFNCLLFVKKDDKIIISEKTFITIYKYFNCISYEIDNLISDQFSSTGYINYDRDIGKLSLYNDNIIYSVLYKNNYYSDLLKNSDECKDEIISDLL